MNINILKKCIDALKEDKPDLSYLRGMLETLAEMQDLGYSSVVERGIVNPKVVGSTPTAPADEASTLDAEAQAKLIQLRKDGLIT